MYVFIQEYWWAVLLMCLGLIVLMALFIKICAVHTPSSNPKLPPAQKLTLPRRHTHRSQVCISIHHVFTGVFFRSASCCSNGYIIYGFF